MCKERTAAPQNAGASAAYWEKTPEGHIACGLCPQACRVAPGQSGFCKIRRHQEGGFIPVNYGRVSSIALDPIEKKPLYHFYPGHPILSVGTIGCSLGCEFCQNWQISRDFGTDQAATRGVTAAELVEIALKTRETDGNIGLAYTYSEPGVWFEFLKEVMPSARGAGLQNVLVTNAYLNPGPWEELLQWTDAANIDLKGFSDQFYRKLCHGKLQPVLDNIRTAVGQIHLELTTLLIPGANDSPAEIEKMAAWIGALDPAIPWHLSRYYPNYKLDNPATPPETMDQAARIAKKYLQFVYVGNLGRENDTFCPECGALWVERTGYRTRVLAGMRCPQCDRRTGLVQDSR